MYTCWSKRNLKYCMLYSVTQRSISFLYSIYIFSINMPQDESAIQQYFYCCNVWWRWWWWWWRYCCCKRLTFATKMHSLVASNVCVNCQRSGSILPQLLELWHCLSYECFFSMTCSLHSLTGKESMLNLAHFSSLRTIDALYRDTIKVYF